MVYRVDCLPENGINPITGQEYDSSWMIFKLTNSSDDYAFTGIGVEGVYSIILSKTLNNEWYLSAGDFVDYCNKNDFNGILVLSESDYKYMTEKYFGHSYNEPILRDGEPSALIHSTTADCWRQIQKCGELKSWDRLKNEKFELSESPIGEQLGDPHEFSKYIMFGGGISGEIVVNSKLCGYINMDVDAEYHTGARLYFDAMRMADDGLLIRDGAHIKVKDSMPIAPYLIWVSTWDKLGFSSPASTPKKFASASDLMFELYCKKSKK